MSVPSCAVPLVTPAARSPRAYPDKPVRFIVPYPPGGGTDVIARIVQDKFRSGARPAGRHRQPRRRRRLDRHRGRRQGGARRLHGALHAVVAHHQPGDLLEADLRHRRRTSSRSARCASLPQILVANPALPGEHRGRAVALAKAKPGAYSYASVGNGSPGHLAGELFKLRTGTQMTHIPYRGGGPAVTDVDRRPGAAAVGLDSRRPRSSSSRASSRRSRSRRSSAARRSPTCRRCRRRASPTSRSIPGTRCSCRRRRREPVDREAQRRAQHGAQGPGNPRQAARAGQRSRRRHARAARRRRSRRSCSSGSSSSRTPTSRPISHGSRHFPSHTHTGGAARRRSRRARARCAAHRRRLRPGAHRRAGRCGRLGDHRTGAQPRARRAGGGRHRHRQRRRQDPQEPSQDPRPAARSARARAVGRRDFRGPGARHRRDRAAGGRGLRDHAVDQPGGDAGQQDHQRAQGPQRGDRRAVAQGLVARARG